MHSSPILVDVASRKPVPPKGKKGKFIRWFAVVMICAIVVIAVAMQMNWIPIRKNDDRVERGIVQRWTSQQSFVFMSSISSMNSSQFKGGL